MLIYSSPGFYDKNLIKELKQNLPNIKAVTVQDILFGILKTHHQSIDTLKWNVFLTQENNSVYLASKQNLDDLSKKRVPMPENHHAGIQHIKDYYEQLLQEYVDMLETLGEKTDKTLQHKDINPVATLLMSEGLEGRLLKKYPAIHLLYQVLQAHLENCPFVIIPGTNRSVASPLLGSRKIISRLLAGQKLKNIDVESKANTHDIGLENNFLDSLSILLISKIALDRKIKILAFCHGAQLLHISLGGFIDYSYRRYNPGFWNQMELELTDNYPLRRALQLESGHAFYYNTVFMEHNDALAKKEGYTFVKKQLSDLVPTNKKQEVIEYFEYGGMIYASQIHVEHAHLNQIKICDFIKKEVGMYKKHYMYDQGYPLKPMTTIQDEPDEMDSSEFSSVINVDYLKQFN